MENYEIYKDIAQRTGGDIYIGVVGPVRTGKSTLIKSFMENVVIPEIDSGPAKERAIDELPQSATGRTIMTTEPKFIPNEAVRIDVDNNAHFNVRLIDCVGYIVPSALGYIENEMPRMVSTPWYEEKIPFNMAAEIGTKKVIDEHSTIGLVVTSDGSFGELERSEFVEAEDRVINELAEINKPFIVLLNCTDPSSEHSRAVADEIARKHGVSVMRVDCSRLGAEDFKEILKQILFEFPVKELYADIPKWMESLESDHWLKRSIIDSISQNARSLEKISGIGRCAEKLNNCEYISKAEVSSINLGEGTASINILSEDSLFYKVLSEMTGIEIDSDAKLVSVLKDFKTIKNDYEKIAPALEEVRRTGYGIVNPAISEMTLEEPQIIKQGGKYGVKLKASAPSIHLMLSDIETEITPIVGTERQSQELVEYLLQDFEENPQNIWQSNLFGKSLHELVSEGLHNKLNRLPHESREKLRETLTRVINEGSGGLICIIL